MITITMITEMINGTLKIGFNLYKMLQEVAGNEPIPTWEELLVQNGILQGKIDAELTE